MVGGRGLCGEWEVAMCGGWAGLCGEWVVTVVGGYAW